tara:strand:- start:20116 stop:20325 length:210 start_codon:yes stop_codon:yes gene_type:complete
MSQIEIKLEDQIATLVQLWLSWVECDKIFHTSKDGAERKRASENCEVLMSDKYKVINKIDEIVERGITI